MNEELPEECCDKCRFAFLLIENGDVTRCKRYPPTRKPAEGIENENWVQPLTMIDDWCGEFQPRKDTP